MKLKNKKVTCGLLALCMLVVILAPSNFYAAGYDSIGIKVLGYGVSLSKTSNCSISTYIVSELTNEKPYEVSTSDTYTITRNITFSKECSSAISSSISSTTGATSGELGSEISKKYSIGDNYGRTYTKYIAATVPAYTKYNVKATIKGDKLSIYYKYFICGICTSKGSGIVYVPKYASWVCC